MIVMYITSPRPMTQGPRPMKSSEGDEIIMRTIQTFNSAKGESASRTSDKSCLLIVKLQASKDVNRS